MGMLSTHFLFHSPFRTWSQVFDKQQWFLSSQNNEPTHLFQPPLLQEKKPSHAPTPPRLRLLLKMGHQQQILAQRRPKRPESKPRNKTNVQTEEKYPLLALLPIPPARRSVEWFFFLLSCYSSKHLQVIACVVELFFFRWCWIPARQNCSDYVAKLKFIFKFWDDSFEFSETTYFF